MEAHARWVAIIAGVLGAVISAAFLLRDVVLAFNAGTVWSLPGWSGWITERPGALRAIVAAVIAALAAIACLWGVVRLLRRPSPPMRKLNLGNEKEALLVDAATLDRFLGKALRRRIPEVHGAKVWLHRDEEDVYRARVTVDLGAACDVLSLHSRVLDLIRDELRRATGLDVARLDLAVERLNLRLKGGS
jgi:hypothetical protein